ncbi:MAG: thioredoxin domain-containing protein [Dehalococcoidia bacterium]
MSSQTTRRSDGPGPHRQGANAQKPRRRLCWFTVAAAVGALVLGAAGLFMLRSHQSSSSHADSSIELLAVQNSGGPVEVHHGVHTVYHSRLPLPTASSPRADGKYTVVWFSGTWCDFCSQMEGFVNSSAAQFRDRLVLMEKSVDDAPADAARFHVRGTPTFVVLDAKGQEVSRFGFIPKANDFTAQLGRLASQVKS